MKQSVLALVLGALLSTPAMADSIDTTPVVATVKLNRYSLREVALLEDGRLQAVANDGQVRTRVLGEASFQFLRQSAIALADVELVTHVNEVVCYFVMWPFSPTLSVSEFDRETLKFTGKLEVTLTARHCGMHKTTVPAQAWAVEEAVSLRDRLIQLALEEVSGTDLI